MFNHFRGWKQKAGLAATATAILLALMWGRSYFAADVIVTPISEHNAVTIVSCAGRVAWWNVFYPAHPYSFPSFPTWVVVGDGPTVDILLTDVVKWFFCFGGFAFGVQSKPDGSIFTMFFIPYWFPTLPTALAAYLLLSDSGNPRKDTADAPQSEEAINLSCGQPNQSLTRILFEYFRGWRRKTGLATLIMACLFATLWFRSLIFTDAVYLESLNMLSCGERIAISRNYKRSLSFPQWESLHGLLDLDAEFGADFKWSMLFCGFGYGGYEDRSSGWLVPHWAIVIPLTVLSARLLLSKPVVKASDNQITASQ